MEAALPSNLRRDRVGLNNAAAGIAAANDTPAAGGDAAERRPSLEAWLGA